MSPAEQMAQNKPRRVSTPVGPLTCRVRQARLAVGLSTQDLAAGTGLSVGWINQLERGARPSAAAVQALSGFFKLPASELWPDVVADRPPDSTGGTGPVLA